MAYSTVGLVTFSCLMAALVRSVNCTSIFPILEDIFVITRDRVPLLSSPLGYDSHQHDGCSRVVALRPASLKYCTGY